MSLSKKRKKPQGREKLHVWLPFGWDWTVMCITARDRPKEAGAGMKSMERRQGNHLCSTKKKMDASRRVKLGFRKVRTTQTQAPGMGHGPQNWGVCVRRCSLSLSVWYRCSEGGLLAEWNQSAERKNQVTYFNCLNSLIVQLFGELINLCLFTIMPIIINQINTKIVIMQ